MPRKTERAPRAYVLYHAACRDGFGSAWAAYRHLGEDGVQYLPCEHGNPPPDLVLGPETEVYVLDFNFPRDTLLAWQGRAGKLQVIDHHVTAKESLAGLPFAIFDMERSAAALTWEYFHRPRPCPRFLLNVEDMDLWRFVVPGTREVCAAIESYPFDFATWDGFAQPTAVARLRREGVVVERFIERQVGWLLRDTMRCEVGGHRDVPCINTSLYISQACSRLLALYPEAPFSAAWFHPRPDLRVWSLRSRRGGVDVAALAKKFGGGGHPTAAGFSLPVEEPFDAPFTAFAKRRP